MALLRSIVLAMALATSAALLVKPSAVPDQVSKLVTIMAGDLSLAPEGNAALSMEARIGLKFPLKYRAEKLTSSMLNSAVASTDSLKKLEAYEKLQLMMSRTQAVMSKYPSFDEFWAALPGQAEVTVQDFSEKWQSLGLPGVGASAMVATPTSELELRVATEIDADGNGAISQSELKQYLFAWGTASVEGCWSRGGDSLFTAAAGVGCSEEVLTKFTKWAGLGWFQWKAYDGAYKLVDGKYVNMER